MKKLMAITLLMILSTVCIFAQHGADGQGLIGLDKQWSATIDHKDSTSIDALNEVTGDDLTRRGGTMNKTLHTEPTLKSVFITRLQANWHNLDEEDAPGWVQNFPWGNSQPVSNLPYKLYFRWSTTEPGITSARWEMTDTQGGFLGGGGFFGIPNIIASGQVNEISAGQLSKFNISFNQSLLQSVIPPKNLYVRVVPYIHQRKRTPTPSVTVRYTN